MNRNNNVGEAAALYAFMGWLTALRVESGPLSGRIDASEAAQLVKAFCESQGWTVRDERWHEKLRPYPYR